MIGRQVQSSARNSTFLPSKIKGLRSVGCRSRSRSWWVGLMFGSRTLTRVSSLVGEGLAVRPNGGARPADRRPDPGQTRATVLPFATCPANSRT